MTPPNHQHMPVMDAHGRNICTSCNMVVVEPILSSDDTRLENAGFHRSGGYVNEIQLFPTLPELLVALYHNGPAVGLPRAPIAPYIEIISQEAWRRSKGSGDPNEIWPALYRGWLEHVQRQEDSNNTK